MTTEELREKAIEMLEKDDDLFVDMVNELDCWNGFADGFRGYPMCELDDLFCDTPPTELLRMITDTFNVNDEYFIETIFGLESTDNLAEDYRDNVFTDELLDEILDKYYSISIFDAEFDAIVEDLVKLG